MKHDETQIIMTSAFHVISIFKKLIMLYHIYWDLVDFMDHYRDSLEVEIWHFRRIYKIVVTLSSVSSGATSIYVTRSLNLFPKPKNSFEDEGN